MDYSGVQGERRRCRDEGVRGRESVGGEGHWGGSINWFRISFAPGMVQPWNMPSQSDERSCGRETDHNGGRWWKSWWRSGGRRGEGGWGCTAG